jgi:hypothetical protein
MPPVDASGAGPRSKTHDRALSPIVAVLIAEIVVVARY